MTIRTPPTRTPTLTPQRTAPDALVIERGELAVGRARAGSPLRREGPDKLTGAAKYADDLVFPGAWFGATIRSTDAHARFVGFDLASDFDWSTVGVVTAADIPGDNIVSLISDDSRSSSRSVARSSTTPSRSSFSPPPIASSFAPLVAA